MVKTVCAALVSCLCVLLSACSSSDSGGGTLNGGGAAAKQCNDFVAKLCDKTASCAQKTPAQCVEENNQYLKQKYGDTCNGADQVSSTYSSCMTDMDSVTCATTELPATCKEVIIFVINK